MGRMGLRSCGDLRGGVFLGFGAESPQSAIKGRWIWRGQPVKESLAWLHHEESTLTAYASVTGNTWDAKQRDAVQGFLRDAQA